MLNNSTLLILSDWFYEFNGFTWCDQARRALCWSSPAKWGVLCRGELYPPLTIFRGVVETKHRSGGSKKNIEWFTFSSIWKLSHPKMPTLTDNISLAGETYQISSTFELFWHFHFLSLKLQSSHTHTHKAIENLPFHMMASMKSMFWEMSVIKLFSNMCCIYLFDKVLL